MFKEPYELSIWEDVVIPASGEVPEYFDEKKIAIIGSNDFETSLRAYDVALKEDINGEKTLSFSMLRKFKDEEGNLLDNPFINLLTNERKIKLRDGEAYSFSEVSDLAAEDTNEIWYDFIVKSIDEDKTSYVNNYVAKELFVNELGKNGWAVTLDTELENNFGTIKELGNFILEGSDWTVSEDSYSPTERIAEPLFKAELTEDLLGTYILSDVPVEISSGKFIYPLYNSVKWDIDLGEWKFKEGEIQFLYGDKEFGLADADHDRIIIDDVFTFNVVTTTVPSTSIILLTGSNGTEALKGNRVVKTQNSRYESTLNQYVNEFEVTNVGAGVAVGTKVFGYTKTEYITPTIIQNLLTNSSNFSSAIAWGGDQVDTKLFPLPSVGNPSDWINNRIFSYLTLDCSTAKVYLNEGLQTAKLALIKDNVYVLRTKARWIQKGAVDGIGTISGTNLATIKGSIRKEGSSTDLTNLGTITTSSIDSLDSAGINAKGYPTANAGARTRYSGGASGTYRDDNQYTYVYLVATETTNVRTDNLRLYLTNTTTNETHDFCIEDIQLFEYKEDENNTPIFIGDLPNATIKETQLFYKVEYGESTFLSSNASYYKPIYRPNYESIRNIAVKESNYFNNIQSLAELFEVWVRFKTYHRKDGKLLLVDGLPKKEVIFSQYAPNGDTINQTGFKYGVNLQSIKRSVDSDSIATKVIVKNNNQEYATDGMASIARANSNPSGENEIYNFNYYINQGLLSYNQMLCDLYGISSTDLAFLTHLRQYNDDYNTQSKLLMSYENELLIIESDLTLYQTQISSADEELLYLSHLMESYNPNDENYKVAKVAAEHMTAKKQAYQLALAATQVRQENYDTLYTAAHALIEQSLADKKLLKLKFYKKYSRFIQEGTWTDEKYTDDDLYFLDAVKVASVSAFPKVSYSIGVLDISRVEGYEAYSFKIGQRTYVEDPEFFGYLYKTIADVGGDIKTPYRESVIVSEYSRNFDDPTKSTITVKNYKNQFEELFQKITATTQSLQYGSGEYARAAAAVTPTGEIDINTLERSFSNNAFVLSNSKNQNVVWDSSVGIEITNNENTSERLRIVSGGIFLSIDAGKTWKSGITGMGINTRYLLAGRIDVAKINLVSGDIPYFRWDTDGISAFKVTEVEGSPTSYDLDRYVRYNQYGIYGSGDGQFSLAPGGDSKTLQQWLDDNEVNPSWQSKVEFIQDHAAFSLTWEGIKLNGSTPGGSIDTGDKVLISAIGGIEIFNGSLFTEEFIQDGEYIADPTGEAYGVGEEIPIISLGGFYDDSQTSKYYGLRMRNNKGNVTLSTDTAGDFWVRENFYVGQKTQDSFYGVGLHGLGLNTNQTSKIQNIFNVTIPDTDEAKLEYGIRIWAGVNSEEIEFANFIILENGFLYASKAVIKGDISVETGRVNGVLTIGQNDNIGFNGTSSSETDFIRIWAGKSLVGEDIAYQFSVDNSGHLHAENVDISGNITVETGSISQYLHINGEDSGISALGDYRLWISGGTIDHPETANFYVDNLGKLYFTDAILRGSILINDSISNNTYGVNGIINETLGVAFWAGDYFYVDKDGNVFANDLNLGGTLSANNTKVTGRLSVTSTINANEYISLDGNTGSIYSGTQSGANWWSISGDGTANFRNIKVRGELETVIFKQGTTSAVGGTLFISPSVNINQDLTVTNNKVKIGNTNLSNGIWQSYLSDFSSTSWVYINKVKIETENYESCEASIINVLNTETNLVERYLDLTGTVLNNLTVIPRGTNFISIDESVNSIKLIAEDPLSSINAGPRFEMRGPQNQSSPTTVFIGNLIGVLTGTAFEEIDNPGYGLFTDNAYLTGKLYLPNAGITNEETLYDGTNIIISEDPVKAVRIWAGSNAANKANAPFVVTQDGFLYASQGEFRGKVIAEDSEFSGWLKTTGILINEDSQESNSVLYVAYDRRNGATDWEPLIADKILQIDKKGLSVWEGGFNVYSDYASGWRSGDTTIPSGEVENLYGDTSGTTQLAIIDPIPYISAIDANEFRLYSSAIHVGRFSSINSFKGVSVKDGEIYFYQADSAPISEFGVLEEQVWNSINGGGNTWHITSENNNLKIQLDSLYTEIDEETIYSNIVFTSENGEIKMENKGISSSKKGKISEQLKLGEYVKIEPNNFQGIDFYI